MPKPVPVPPKARDRFQKGQPKMSRFHPTTGRPIGLPAVVTPDQDRGRGPWLLDDLQARYSRLSAGELARSADALGMAPLALRADVWPHLVAIARAASERLLVLSIVDGAGEQEVAS